MIVWWRLAYVWWKCPKDKNKWMCRSHESQSRDVVMIKFKTFLCSYESQSRDVRRIETNETYLMCSHESQSTVQCDRIETIYLCYREWQSRDSKNWPTIWESKKIQSHFPQPIWLCWYICFTLGLVKRKNWRQRVNGWWMRWFVVFDCVCSWAGVITTRPNLDIIGSLKKRTAYIYLHVEVICSCTTYMCWWFWHSCWFVLNIYSTAAAMYRKASEDWVESKSWRYSSLAQYSKPSGHNSSRNLDRGK